MGAQGRAARRVRGRGLVSERGQMRKRGLARERVGARERAVAWEREGSRRVREASRMSEVELVCWRGWGG